MFVSSHLKTNPTSWTPGKKTCKLKYRMRDWRLWRQRMSFFCVCVCISLYIRVNKCLYVGGYMYCMYYPFSRPVSATWCWKFNINTVEWKNKTSLRLLQSLRRMPQPRFCSGAPEMFRGPQNVTRLSISLRASRERLNLSVSVNLSLKAHVSTQGWAVAD